jgi:lipoprotein NlpI
MLRTFLAGLPALVLAAGCVQVQLAQDKPLDINLNVNIKQEVVVTLKGEAQDLIKNNPGVF